MKKIIIHNTHGRDDIERASLAFVMANVARSSNQHVIVLLTIDGVWVATQGYAAGLQAPGFAPLSDLIQQYVDNDGQIWVCEINTKPRNITANDLIEGAELIGVAVAVEILTNGVNGLSF